MPYILNASVLQPPASFEDRNNLGYIVVICYCGVSYCRFLARLHDSFYFTNPALTTRSYLLLDRLSGCASFLSFPSVLLRFSGAYRIRSAALPSSSSAQINTGVLLVQHPHPAYMPGEHMRTTVRTLGFSVLVDEVVPAH